MGVEGGSCLQSIPHTASRPRSDASVSAQARQKSEQLNENLSLVTLKEHMDRDSLPWVLNKCLMAKHKNH